jgi:hypothetical protein
MVSKKLSTHHIHVDGDFVEPLIKEAGFIDVAAQDMKMKGGIWGNRSTPDSVCDLTVSARVT